MIKVTFEKDYSKDFNIKFYGLIKVNIIYENGKVVSIKEKKKAKELLEEITKFKEFVKTDNLKEKMEDWDNTFKLIRDEAIPSITDSISDADFLIDRKEYKQAIRKMANIEMELRVLKKKTDKLLEEVQLITKSEERNRTLITKLKIVYREQQNKFERGNELEEMEERLRELQE